MKLHGGTEVEGALPSRSRVLYIGHLPHGFYEDQLLGYFSQFGRVTRVRVSRAKKNGRAKGYAFVEFQLPEVAETAAEAMDGYMMFRQKLVCRVVPVEKQHPQLFKGANRRFRVKPVHKLEAERHAKSNTPKGYAKRVERLAKRSQARLEKLRDAGIEYEFDAAPQMKVRSRIVFDDDEEEEEEEEEEPVVAVKKKKKVARR
ncbi:unnamed protein product [Pedinophyceae sp. YPF-701]|nr:unnamed protein product [Pedinophyceae sp. YPF-701]